MRTFLFLFSILVTPALAQDKPPADKQELDKDTQTRIRVERAAGGLGKITDEEKEGAGAGAGPHLTRPHGAARREPREESPSTPGEQGVKSGNGPNDARRP